MANPPAIDRNQLQKLADLARLHLPAERQAVVLENLQRIVAAFDAVRALPIAPPQPGAPSGPNLLLRADAEVAPMPLDQVLANAPRHAGGLFVVPRVVDA